MRSRLLTLLLTLVLPVVALVVIVGMGLVEVGARAPVSSLERWLFGTIAERSIARRAASAPSAPVLHDAARVEAGARHYRDLCATCHGGPGMERSPIGAGLNPPAPDLVEEAGEWSDAELYWIVENGIRMSGMPAFADALTPEQRWAVVAYLRSLPRGR
jgi:mono/diheme cytochrome c family protein